MQYKICPTCNYKNSIDSMICKECMTDISGILPSAIIEENKNLSDSSIPEIPGQEAKKEIETIPFSVHGSKDSGNEDKTVLLYTPLKIELFGTEMSIHNGDILGRSHKGSHILREYPEISRKHVQFIYKNHQWYVEDLGSTNGTWLNHRRMEPAKQYKIQSGNILTLAKYDFKIM